MLENNPVIIVGGGHAGVEAAFALARQKIHSLLITMDKRAVGRLSCNPAVGGLAKSHLVKEIDALGGVMGHAADSSALQLKVLNKTKGRAVWSLRAQVDKKKYPQYIVSLIKKSSYISVLEDEVVGVGTKGGGVERVLLKKGLPVSCPCLIVTCGTFLNGRVHVGSRNYPAGRLGEKPSAGLTESLVAMGLESGRLKTGTPPRISRSSIDLTKCTKACGDEEASPFSLFSNSKKNKNEPCFLVNTNKKTHEIINKNIPFSSMFSGKITGVGPRYCPSIEDKVFRFKERSSHHLFLEPEWLDSNQIYINGFSTSLPETAQKKALRSISGLENAEIIRPGYAIEYDFIPPRQLKASLESKNIGGLFLAGQMNGTSGYEEAAAQGLVAGLNAGRLIKEKAPVLFGRESSYIGVMIDDLITSHLDEPYRMFTSRAEHRLFLRSDNAYSRLFPLACSSKALLPFQKKRFNDYFKTLSLVQDFSEEKTKYLDKKNKMKAFIKMPGVTFQKFNFNHLASNVFIKRCLFEIETNIKYEGYIKNEEERMEKNKTLESLKIPLSFVYKNLPGLSSESVERLEAVRPETLGQASRIFGIRPTDITVLGSCLCSFGVSRET